MVSARLWPQTWHLGNLMPLNEFANFLSTEPSSLFSISPLYFHVLWLTLVTDFAVLGLCFALFPSCAMSLYILDSHSPGLQLFLCRAMD